jgi:methionyl-tRNA formyltransferase
MKKLTLFAMSEKGYEVVKALSGAYPGIVDTVISSRDSNIAGDFFEEIRKFCGEKAIKFFERSAAPAVTTEYAVAVSWRWMIRESGYRLIIMHDSLLPRYRGFNPLVSALINGESEIGVTAIYAAKDYDRGDVIASSKTAVAYPKRIQEAIGEIIKCYVELALKIADDVSRGVDPAAAPQNENEASYSLWRDESDYYIDWSRDAGYIRRFVDAVGYPYKGAAAKIDGKTLRIIRAEALNDVKIENRSPGKVIFTVDSKPVVVCGSGLLKINEALRDDTGSPALPLANFRTRFTGKE